MELPFVKIPDHESGTLYVRHTTMLEAGVPEGSLKSASLREKKRSDGWVIDDPSDKRRNLYHYEDMPQRYRDMVNEWLLATKGFASPYEYMALQPIRDAITHDDKAEAWFLGYQYTLNGKPEKLKPEQISSATRNASLLNMLLHLKGKKREVKKRYGMDWLPFVEQVVRVIKADGYNLPTTYRNLIMVTLEKYERLEYEALLPPRLGNQSSAKIKNDDLSKDMLLELLSHPNQYDDAYIFRAYNAWAKTQGKTLLKSKATIRNKRIDYGYMITESRKGWQEHNKVFNRSIQRTPPSQPTYLWEGDDNHIDWWFVDDSNKILRLKAYVVTDSYKGINYPLGWAYSENDITEETVRLAFLMAMHHVYDLTGGWYLPHEVKTDRWGLKSLQPFYEGLGHYYPTPVGSKNRGWLETFFGHPDWKRSLRTDPYGLPAPNYTGHNISSKTMGVNQEALQQAYQQKQLPHISEAGKWITAHFERLRTLPIGYDEQNKSRQQEWLEAWAAMSEDRKRRISEEQFLIKCGLVHNANGGNQITKAGVQPTIAGKTYSFAVPPAFYLPNVGRKVFTIYSPFDMSKALITDGEKLRFVAGHITPVAGCMADMQEGGRSFLNQILAEKKADVATITQAKKDRRNRLQAAGMASEVVLKLGAAATKELKVAATESYEEAELIYDTPVAIIEDEGLEDIEDKATNSL